MKFIILPKDCVVYRATNRGRDEAIRIIMGFWYTFNIIQACVYLSGRRNAIQMLTLKKNVRLINILSLSLSELSDVKNIDVGDQKISLRFLFKVIFGYGMEKNGKEFFRGNIDDPRHKGTQIYEFYQLTKAVGEEENTLRWFEKIKQDPPLEINMDKFSFNRLSDSLLDKKFLLAMKREFKNVDGYYAPKLSSNWSRLDNVGSKRSVNKYNYVQPEELAIYNSKKLQPLKTFAHDSSKLCDIILS